MPIFAGVLSADRAWFGEQRIRFGRRLMALGSMRQAGRLAAVERSGQTDHTVSSRARCRGHENLR